MNDQNIEELKAKKMEDLLIELKLVRTDLERIKKGESLGRKFLLSLIGGFGTILGATLLVSIVVLILKPFASIKYIEPLVDGIVEIVDRNKND